MEASRFSKTGSIRVSDSITIPSPEAEFLLKRQAFHYMHSFPGDDSAAKNHFVHGACIQLLRGRKLTNLDLRNLAGNLYYRQQIIRRATDYKNRLGLESPDCDQYDVQAHRSSFNKDPRKKALYSINFTAVNGSELFDNPGEHGGLPYIKGCCYLAAVMAEAEWDEITVTSMLGELVKLRGM